MNSKYESSITTSTEGLPCRGLADDVNEEER